MKVFTIFFHVLQIRSCNCRLAWLAVSLSVMVSPYLFRVTGGQPKSINMVAAMPFFLTYSDKVSARSLSRLSASLLTTRKAW